MMKNLFIVIISIFFLAGCDMKEEMVLKNTILFDSGSVAHFTIPVTGSVEVYRDSSFFKLFENNPKCRKGGSLEDSLYCEGISGYNHVYKISSLKLEYLYESERLAPYVSSGVENFLSITGGINYIQDRILMLRKDPRDSSLEVIKSHLGKGGCDIGTGRLGTGYGYDSYGVWMYRDTNIEDYEDISNRCIPDLPVDKGNDSWLYVFSTKYPDYYYIISMNMTAGSGPQIYTDKSLKLFVE